LDPRMADIVGEKMSRTILPQGARAGGLTPRMAEKLGLKAGTAVAVANVDAHVAVPAATVVSPNKMVMVMGTSICHLVLGERELEVEGMCGVVEDGILPGYYGFEAGQSAVGDIFGWFVETCVPEAYAEEARRRGLNVHQLLEEKASRLAPGESGLLALDWWNGNRSILVDADLTGMMLGMSLTTRPEEMYRALIEATAFGTRVIIDALESGGLATGESGVMALDRWNGNRSILVDADVSGMMLGMCLTTRPEEMYRALIEATAFGTRVIIDAFESAGLAIEELYACGGLPERNQLLMQIYADVTNRSIKVARSSQTPALGSAMFGAVAAGPQAGGYASITEAAARMAGLKDVVYRPDPGRA